MEVVWEVSQELQKENNALRTDKTSLEIKNRMLEKRNQHLRAQLLKAWG